MNSGTRAGFAVARRLFHGMLVSVFFGALIPSNHTFAALSPVQPSKVAAGSGEGVPVLSYCAHWFSRDGKACLTSASAGQQVAVNAFDAPDLASAAATCQRTGCKISLYCECASAGDVARVAGVFGELVNRYGSQMFVPHVEVDGIRDISGGARIAVADALRQHGFSLILKNMATVSEFSSRVLVARVVYEDLVNNGTYAQEFKQLANAYPSLLLTGIVHEGGYDGDSGSTEVRAMERFKEYGEFKNVELFFGRPGSFAKVKSFDGAMTGIAQGQGTIVPFSPGTGAPPGSSRILNNTGQLLSGLNGLQAPLQASPVYSQPTTAIPSSALGQSFSLPSPVMVPNIGTAPNTAEIALNSIVGPSAKHVDIVPRPTPIAISNNLRVDSVRVTSEPTKNDVRPTSTSEAPGRESTFISQDLRYSPQESAPGLSPTLLKFLSALRDLLLGMLSLPRF